MRPRAARPRGNDRARFFQPYTLFFRTRRAATAAYGCQPRRDRRACRGVAARGGRRHGTRSAASPQRAQSAPRSDRAASRRSAGDPRASAPSSSPASSGTPSTVLDFTSAASRASSAGAAPAANARSRRGCGGLRIHSDGEAYSVAARVGRRDDDRRAADVARCVCRPHAEREPSLSLRRPRERVRSRVPDLRDGSVHSQRHLADPDVVEASATTLPSFVEIATVGALRSGQAPAVPSRAAAAASRIAGSDDFGVPSA